MYEIATTARLVTGAGVTIPQVSKLGAMADAAEAQLADAEQALASAADTTDMNEVVAAALNRVRLVSSGQTKGRLQSMARLLMVQQYCCALLVGIQANLVRLAPKEKPTTVGALSLAPWPVLYAAIRLCQTRCPARAFTSERAHTAVAQLA